MAVVGLGMDVCAVERIRQILTGPRAERFLDRVFTPAERQLCSARSDAASAYAARFAAKEALVKALGGPEGLRWQDIEVARAPNGAPGFNLSGFALEAVTEKRARALLALTHDAGIAAATVVLESEP
jgi:holo-[acyl-carrier protein] synthase